MGRGCRFLSDHSCAPYLRRATSVVTRSVVAFVGWTVSQQLFEARLVEATVLPPTQRMCDADCTVNRAREPNARIYTAAAGFCRVLRELRRPLLGIPRPLMPRSPMVERTTGPAKAISGELLSKSQVPGRVEVRPGSYRTYAPIRPCAHLWRIGGSRMLVSGNSATYVSCMSS